MIKISKEHVDHLANLARIMLTEKDKKKYAGQLSAVLDYFKRLDELDTADIEPLAQAGDLLNVLRPDESRQIFSQEKCLAEAPELVAGQFSVKRVLDKYENQ